MKRKTTKEILAESFKEVAGQKNVNKITVNDIVINCDMSASTFYRYFHDKYDLISWIYKCGCMQITKKYKTCKDTLFRVRSIITEWVDFCEANIDFLVNLIRNTKDYDSFNHYMVNLEVKYLENRIMERSGKDALTKTAQAEIYLYASGSVLLMCSWLLGDIAATKDELVKVMIESNPPSLIALP